MLPLAQLLQVQNPQKQKDALCYILTVEEYHWLLVNCFVKKTTRDRRLLAQKLRVCFVCLLKNHNSSNCRNKIKCRHCSSLHHELLCPSVRAQDGAFLVDEDIDSAVDEQLDELQDVLTDQ